MDAYESGDSGLTERGFNVHIFIFNNDKFRDCYGVVPYVKEPEICYEGAPHMLIAVEPRSPEAAQALPGLDGRGYRLALLGESGRKILEIRGRLRLARSPTAPLVAVSRAGLPGKVPDAVAAVVEVGSLRETVRLPRQVRVYGRVTDFRGRPRPAYVELVQPYGFPGGTAITKTDGEGRYEMLVPEAVYHHAFVCDGGYARTSLEFYAWYVPVRPPSFRMDARFDQVEIYRLAAAQTPERTLLVHFVVWDNAYSNRVLEEIYRRKGRIGVRDVCEHNTMPLLARDDVEVYLGDNKLEVRSLALTRYSVKDYGEDCLAPAYLLEAKIPGSIPRGIYPLRVVAHVTVGGTEEWGEAVLYDVKII